MVVVFAAKAKGERTNEKGHMMQAGVDSLADAGFHCNVCIVEDGSSLLIYVLYDGQAAQNLRRCKQRIQERLRQTNAGGVLSFDLSHRHHSAFSLRQYSDSDSSPF